MARRTGIIALALTAFVLAAVSGGWLAAAALAESAFQQWAEDRRADGYEVAWETLEITGFPVRLNGRIGTARLARATDDQSWQWQPPTLLLKFFPLAPNRIDLQAPGQHDIAITVDGETTRLTATAEAATSQLRLDRRGNIDALSVNVLGLDVASMDQSLRLTAASGEFVGERLPPGDKPGVAPSIISGTRLTGVVLPEELAGPLGTQLTSLAAEAALLGEVPPGPLEPALTRWRDTGGSIDIRNASMVWGPVRAIANGVLSLDLALQPEGRFDTEVTGMDGAITAYEDARLLDQQAAALARIAVAALSRTPPEGGAAVVRLPLSIRQRQVMLGPLRLLTLPQVRWP